MILTIDLEADRPIYLQIADAVRRAIVSGELGPGDALPPGREVSATLGVNLETVQRAYRALADEGIVLSRVGRGTRVAESVDVSELGITRIVDELVSQARQLGMASGDVLSVVERRLEAG